MDKKIIQKLPIVLPEKHPLQEIPAESGIPVSEEELDLIPNDEEVETPPYDPPVEGEGP